MLSTLLVARQTGIAIAFAALYATVSSARGRHDVTEALGR